MQLKHGSWIGLTLVWSLLAWEGQAQVRGLFPSTEKSLKGVVEVPATTPTVSINPEIVNGQLNETSNILNDGSYFNVHSFEGTAGEQIAIELTSEAFDPYLILLDPDGNKIAENDDGGEGYNALIVVTLPVTGNYQVIANSYGAGERGAYRLAWSEASAIEIQRVEAERLFQQGAEQYQISQFDEAIRLWQRALDIYREIGDFQGEANSLNNLGSVHNSIGQYRLAVEYYEQSLTIFHEIGDRRGKAYSILGIGNAYSSLGEYQLAVEYYEQSLAISREISDRVIEASSIGGLGATYDSLGEYYRAGEYHNQALVIFDEIDAPHDEAISLNNLGSIHSSLGEYQRAIEYYEQSLAISREIGALQNEAKSLNGLGLVYVSLGEYQRAIEYHEQSFTISNEIGDRASEANSIANLGSVYNHLGNYSRAIEFHGQSLPIFREVGSLEGESNSLNNLGLAYESLGEYQRAIEYYEQALPVSREIGDQESEAIITNNLGLAYESLGEYQRAIEYYEQALPVSREIENREIEAAVLGNLGSAYYRLSEDSSATEYYEQSLSISHEIGARESSANSFHNIAKFLSLQNQSELGIAVYKHSINTYEFIRNNLQGLSHIEQESYAEKVAFAYRNLVDLLLENNRILEAQRVLDLLRQQELEEFLRNTRGNENTIAGIDLLPAEQRLIDLFYQNLEADTLDGFWDSPEVRDIATELNTASEYATLPNLQNVQSQIADTDTATLQLLALDDRLELVLGLPDSDPRRATVDLDRPALNRLVSDARQALTNPLDDPKPALQALYAVLIEPIRDDLDAAGIDTLVYSPDGILRYVPLAALHDGNGYLVERYAVNHVTAVSLTDFDAVAGDNPNIFAGAFANGRYAITIDNETYNYSGLPGADTEVAGIASLFETAQTVRDADFSKNAVETHLDRAEILHFATHAQFVPGLPFHSFVLFGNGEYATFEDLRDWELPRTDLVVLSACETGVEGVARGDNGIEILGFSYLMQEAGANATLSSLWRVNDSSTSDFMQRFYQVLAEAPEENVGKAEALRQVQLSFIRGELTTGDVVERAPIESRDEEPVRSSVGYAHPYYWSPFILIGNGL